MYLVITLAVGEKEIVQALGFRSERSAEAALADLQTGTDEVVTLDSDTGDSLTVRRDAITESHLASTAPSQQQLPARVDPNDLIRRLGRPIYDGQNTFGAVVGQPPYTITFSNRRDRVMVWDCGGPHLNRCMAECYSDTECRYWPCAIHQGDPLAG